MTIIGIAGSAAASAFGGWDRFLQTLIIFMIIDWVTGGILLPVVFGKSPKSKTAHWRAGPDGKDFTGSPQKSSGCSEIQYKQYCG